MQDEDDDDDEQEEAELDEEEDRFYRGAGEPEAEPCCVRPGHVSTLRPMASDSPGAFGPDASDELIDAMDADAVAAVAIQGLSALVQEKDAEIEELRTRVERLEGLANAVLAR